MNHHDKKQKKFKLNIQKSHSNEFKKKGREIKR